MRIGVSALWGALLVLAYVAPPKSDRHPSAASEALTISFGHLAPEQVLAWSRTQRCANLFSSLAPDWTRRDLFSIDPLDLVGPEWYPFCSEYVSTVLLSREPPIAQVRGRALFKKTQEFIRDLDTCDPSRRHVKENRYSSKYVALSQESQKVRPMKSTEFAKFKNEAERIKARVAKTCCENDADCLSLFGQIPIRFCEPQKDPKAIDPCVGRDGYSAVPERGDAVDILNGRPGYLRLSKYVSTKSGNPVTDVRELMSHELGHACIDSWLKVELKRGNPDAKYDSINQYLKQSCEIGSSTRKLYLQRIQALGFSGETAECLFDMSDQAPRTRFAEGSCEKGCARLQLDEGFAELFSTVLENQTDELIPHRLPEACLGLRDPRHPLSMDIIACTIKTAAIRTRWEKLLECAK
jgi:hypothetical protein